jgi:hypothetical protein
VRTAKAKGADQFGTAAVILVSAVAAVVVWPVSCGTTGLGGDY